MRTVILWTHAISGAIWIGACACFVIAGIALADGSLEQRSFLTNAAPKINRLGAISAALLLVTGLINFAILGAIWRFAYSAQFLSVLAAKVALFVAMTIALTYASRVGIAMRQMVRAHIAIVVMGGIALMLGLWLMGT